MRYFDLHEKESLIKEERKNESFLAEYYTQFFIRNKNNFIYLFVKFANSMFDSSIHGLHSQIEG